MGSKCCSCLGGSAKDSVKTSTANLQDQTTVEESKDVNVPSKPEPQIPILTPSEVLERTGVDPTESEETSKTRESPRDLGQYEMPACYRASNLLWSTGSFSDPIPDGFYSVIHDNRLEHFQSIPTLDELRALGEEGHEADVILVDFEKDTKLDRLKQWVNSLVGGSNTNPVKVIKKIAGVVVGFYKQQGNLQSPTKATQSFESSGFPLLGQIKTGSCRVRAILFKVLADSVGLESKLVVGFPSDLEISESDESYKHLSVVVTLNTVEMMIDLTRSNGQLIPMSTKALYMAHSGSCHSPLGPNSPMYMNRVDPESLSRSDPNIATESLRAASSSPQDPNVRGEGSMLRKSLSATPEISDDISRSVRDISETLKQSHDDSSPHQSLLPYEKWNIDFSELEVGTSVGIGCFAEVFRGMWKGKDVAIKMFRDQTVDSIKDISNEISILSRLQHPNVVTFLGACIKASHLSVVTEYVEKGSMYQLLHSTDEIKNLSWQTKLNMLRDICRGLMCIHEMGIVHRDIKSANCLLTDEWTVKICDFGLSRIMEGTTTNDTVPAGTPEWIAPEVIRNEPLTEKCDIFSFGVIMWELCTLSKPWEGVPKDKVIYTVANEGARLEIPEGPLGKLIADCWSEPEQRPSCEEILTYLATCEDSLC